MKMEDCEICFKHTTLRVFDLFCYMNIFDHKILIEYNFETYFFLENKNEVIGQSTSIQDGNESSSLIFWHLYTLQRLYP